MRSLVRAFVLFAFVLPAQLACNGGATPAAPQAPEITPSPCDAIAKRCHGGTSEVAQDCHHVGHAGDATACSAKRDACLAACPAH